MVDLNHPVPRRYFMNGFTPSTKYRYLPLSVLFSLVAVSNGFPSNDIFGPPDFLTGLGSFRFIAIDDLDKDGALDLVVGKESGNEVSVFLGNGDGTFGPATTFPAGDVPWSVATADFDNDGNLDLAIADRKSGDVSILQGNGDGTFGPDSRLPAGSLTQAVATGDFNRDGNPDLAVANRNLPDLVVFLGNGDLTFGPGTNLAAGNARQSALAVIDLDGDGNEDLTVANEGDSQFAVLLGDGIGNFQPASFFLGGGVVTSFAAADFDADGRIDVAMPSWFEDLAGILLGAGDGSFGPRTTVNVGSFPTAAAAADFNLDGKEDIAVANLVGQDVSISLGNGFGGFMPDVRIPISAAANHVSVGDFNGDAKPDLAVATGSGVAILLNRAVRFGVQCEATPSSLNLQAQGNTLTIKTTVTNLDLGTVLDPSLLAPAFIARILSSSAPINLPAPRAEPGCDDFLEDGIWETLADRTTTGSGQASMRFSTPADGQCETMDGNRQDIIALMLDIPDGEVAEICHITSHPDLGQVPIECCAGVRVTNHGNR